MKLGAVPKTRPPDRRQLELRLEDLEPPRPPKKKQPSNLTAALDIDTTAASASPLPADLRARDSAVGAEAGDVSGLRRFAECVRRRCFRDVGVRAGALYGDPDRASEVPWHTVQSDRTRTRAASANRSWIGGTGFAGPCVGLEVCRSSAAVPAVGDLRSRGRGSGSFDAGGWVAGATARWSCWSKRFAATS